MAGLTILYDGWPLSRQPDSPAALHLLSLLAHLPAAAQAVVALPAQPPAWLPENATVQVHPAPDTPGARLRWEQRTLPKLVDKLGIDLLHLTSTNPALFGQGRSVISPADFRMGSGLVERHSVRQGLASRLRTALAQGGLTRTRAILWPSDLPDLELDIPIPVMRLPPVVHPAFTGDQPEHKNGSNGSFAESIPVLDLPETFVLYHGPHHPQALHNLLNAWSWAAGPIGELYPLLVPGLDGRSQKELVALRAEYNLGESVRPLPAMPPVTLASLYRGCAALFHPAPTSPWGGPLRPALVCKKPVVALENRLADAIAGPAAYLVPGEPGDPDCSRALGAALITVVVEESLAESLQAAAQQRSAAWVTSWQTDPFGQQLLAAYQSILSKP